MPHWQAVPLQLSGVTGTSLNMLHGTEFGSIDISVSIISPFETDS